MVLAVSAFAALALLAILPFLPIDRTAILRFIAPTAFETRPLEVLIEGGRPR